MRRLSSVPLSALLLLAFALLGVSAQQDGVVAQQPIVDEIIVEPVFTAADMPDGVMREAMTIDFASDGTIFLNERRGFISQIDPQTGHRIELIDMANQLEEFYLEPSGGLVGMALQPGFDYKENNLIYVAYTPRLYHRQISTFEYKVDSNGVPYIDPTTENIIYKWDITHSNNNDSRHVGGDIRFGPDGKLYVALGDEVSASHSQGYAPIDQRPGFEYNNALLTSQNPLHPSGSILRLNPDGSIPEDNPFVDDPNVLDEIWALGFRNPFRIHIDSVTGWVLVGDNGPDASSPNPTRGPAGMGTYRLVWEGGQNHGWPICTGANEPYIEYDFATGSSGEPFDCSEMTPALVWIPYAQTSQFPALGTGGTSPIGGVILRKPAEEAPYQWHEHYLNHWYTAEFSRGFIAQIRLEDGGTKLPEHSNWHDLGLSAPDDYGKVPPPPGLDVNVWLSGFIQPIDLRQSPDGALYLLTMGSGWRVPNADAGIYRIYNKTMYDPPVAVASAAPWSGQAPLEVTFSAAGSVDTEGSGIQAYIWDFGDGHTAEGIEVTHVYTENSTYEATLEVIGSLGNSGVSEPIVIVVGNTAPEPRIANPVEGALYDRNQVVPLRGSAWDAEDGELPADTLHWEVLVHYMDPQVRQTKVILETTGATAEFRMLDDDEVNWHGDVTYTVRLTASDSEGLSNTVERRIRYTRLQAQVADAMHDFTLEPTDAPDSELHAVTSTQNAYLGFEGVNLSGRIVGFLQAKSDKGALLELRSGRPDGDVLARYPIQAGGNWEVVQIPVAEFEGVHDLYIVVALLHEGSIAINWFQLLGPGTD